MKSIHLFSIAILSCAVSACKPMDLHETTTAIPHRQWKSGFHVTGRFVIPDTSAYYKLFVVLRHTDAYKYNNIWLDMGLQAPGDSMKTQRIEVPLGSDATGWFGSGMDNIWEARFPLNKVPQKFFKPGEYNFTVRQAMRDDPLPEILNVGIRVEKTGL